MLDVPGQLAPLLAVPPKIAHTWNEGDPMVALGNENATLLAKVGALSFRVVLGPQAALGEWMICRFAGAHDDEELDQLAMAIWEASIDFRYLNAAATRFPRARAVVAEG